MSDESAEAYEVAVLLFGHGAIVGRGAVPNRWEYGIKCWVGKRISATWILQGVGDTYWEAFNNVQEMELPPHVHTYNY